MAKRERFIRKKLAFKEERELKDFEAKMGILKANFNQNISKLVKNINFQRDTISQSYGPLVLQPKQAEKPIFVINPEIDADGHKKQKFLLKRQNEVPGILNIHLLEARCLKDKVGPGYFIMRVKILSRIGASPIVYDVDDCYEDYKELSQSLRYYDKKKRAYLDKEHREMEVKDDSGNVISKAAVATGLNFFQANQQKQGGEQVDLERIKQENERMATTLLKDGNAASSFSLNS